jgi:hypothetical protein
MRTPAEQKMPKRLQKWLEGKKSYLTAATILVVGALNWYGYQVPTFVWAALGALGLSFLRAGVQKK